MKRVLSLDVGDVRIGIALSDSMRIIASPLQTLKRSGNDLSDANFIADLVKQHDVDLIVSGLPLSMKGSDSIQTEKVREFVKIVEIQSGVPVKFVDERLTTVSAERALIEGNVRRQDRKKYIDKVAAAIILQSFLDYHKN